MRMVRQSCGEVGEPCTCGGVGTGWGDRGGGDGDVLAQLAEQVETAAERVAELKRLDGAVQDERGPSKSGRVGALPCEEDGPELLQADEQGVEQVACPVVRENLQQQGRRRGRWRKSKSRRRSAAWRSKAPASAYLPRSWSLAVWPLARQT